LVQQEQVKRDELSSKLQGALTEMRSRIEEGEEYRKILENHEKSVLPRYCLCCGNAHFGPFSWVVE